MDSLLQKACEHSSCDSWLLSSPYESVWMHLYDEVMWFNFLSHWQKSLVAQSDLTYSLAINTFKAYIITPLQKFRPLKYQIPDFVRDIMSLSVTWGIIVYILYYLEITK